MIEPRRALDTPRDSYKVILSSQGVSTLAIPKHSVPSKRDYPAFPQSWI